MANQMGRFGVGKVQEDEGPWRVERMGKGENSYGVEERGKGRRKEGDGKSNEEAQWDNMVGRR